jgi:lipopolysaccharide export system protein LptA
MRAGRVISLLVLAAGLAALPGRADEALSSDANPPNTDAAIGVMAFEQVGPAGSQLPDVASRLADQLAAKAALRVVGPDGLDVPALAEPPARDVREWAAAAGVSELVVGRTTRLGRKLSVDARLRSGASGEVIGTYVMEISRGDELGPAVAGLADQILDALGTPRRIDVALAPAPAAAAAPAQEETPAEGGGLLDVGLSGGGGPIDISAGETEFLLENGRTIFRDNVRVVQGDVTLTTDHLEVDFDEASREPRQLVAKGNVRIVQGDRTVTCERAIYEAAEQRVFCRGNADAVIGKNTVRGEEIEFRVDQNRVFVRGTTSAPAEVRIAGEEKSPPAEVTP